MKEISAGGVVCRKRNGQIQVLLIEDRYGRWTLPKGKKEAGESDEQTALREIEEETGIIGKIIEKLYTAHYEYIHRDAGKVRKEVIYFLVEAIEGRETPQLSEIRGLNWCSMEEALRLQKEKGYDTNDPVFERAFHLLKKNIYHWDDKNEG
ncbi:NUDIX hydrolase [Paenactinomyces guangxiensis]|uniref:NUDIX domain-containing protein n=1 Tax=Paenactinomyces guangxiensis TaxID=1490290 RepID=A0A7W2A7T9_9BACL|nr:NUDIX domain-containing protein [Paenactinomyces guangxiensis]MBA4493143.1 NUDIX domain-containing protein [Paenactinomyces guangxiensis]MBH8590007.1 NUDIX domain-containing protein [Paenactinomyces guangxiensis]